MKKKAVKSSKPHEFSVVGIQYRTTLPVRRKLAELVPFSVVLVREPKNTHDPNAIAVQISEGTFVDGMKIGYLRRQVAEVLAPALDSGEVIDTKAEMKMIDPEISEGVAEIWLSHAAQLGLDKIAS